MEVIIQPTREAASKLGARIVARLVRETSSPVLGLATGSTPLALYKELLRMHAEDALSFEHVTTFNLDEYVGLPPGYPPSYNHFMQEHLFKHINLRPENAHVPDGLTKEGWHIQSFRPTAAPLGGTASWGWAVCGP